MTDDNPRHDRRRFLEAGAATLATLPVVALIGAMPRAASAASMAHLKETSDLARGLEYRGDATRSKRTGPNQFCHDCMNYAGKAGDAWGPCKIFPHRLVNANGWCLAWIKKS